MKNRLSIFLTLVALSIFCSCNKSLTPSITLSHTSTTFPYTGATAIVGVTCNCSWTATCDVENVVVTPSSYDGDCENVTIKVPEFSEKTTTPVRVTFTATSGESTSTAKFVVTVLAKPYIEIPQAASTIYVPSQANGLRINIESNTEWIYESSPDNKDLTVSPTSGTYNDVVSISFPENTTSAEKTYILTFKMKGEVWIPEYNTIITTAKIKFIQYAKQ